MRRAAHRRRRARPHPRRHPRPHHQRHRRRRRSPLVRLADLDAGGGRPIPRLADLFAWAHDAASRGPAPFLNLELKMPGVGPDTLAALAATRYPGPVALSSFDYPSLVETRHLDPSIELWYLNVAFTPDLIDKAHAIRPPPSPSTTAPSPPTSPQTAAANLAIAWTVDLAITRLLALHPPLRTLSTNVPDIAVSASLNRRTGERGTSPPNATAPPVDTPSPFRAASRMESGEVTH
ncbi:MAG: hypothetical protein U0232_08010 [Thermomicrobiales bacterium]